MADRGLCSYAHLALLVQAGTGSELLAAGKLTQLDIWRGLYFSAVTMATVGYGAIAPPVDPENVKPWLLLLVTFQI